MSRLVSLLSRSEWLTTLALYTAGTVVLLAFGSFGGLLSVFGVESSGLTLLLLVGGLTSARLTWMRLERAIKEARHKAPDWIELEFFELPEGLVEVAVIELVVNNEPDESPDQGYLILTAPRQESRPSGSIVMLPIANVVS